VGRSLVRSGHLRTDAERLARALSERHGESSRDRMRYIFKDVPAIYGFSSVAPLGPTAASMLRGYFQSGGGGEIGSGRGSASCRATSRQSMVTSAGDSDARAADRRDVCQFSDDRLSAAQRLAFVHRLLGREMAEARMFLDRIEKYAASLSATERRPPAVARELEAIATDQEARARYLDFARDADQPAVRARMIALAGDLGWLSPAEQRAELMQMIADQVARNKVGAADVDLICTLNKDHELDQELDRLHRRPRRPTIRRMLRSRHVWARAMPARGFCWLDQPER
jgi:hypothetical protein